MRFALAGRTVRLQARAPGTTTWSTLSTLTTSSTGKVATSTTPTANREYRRRELVAAAAAYGLSNLRVFGSVARGQDRPDSEVDLLADLPPDLGLLGLGRVQAEVEAIVGTRVDLVPAGDLKSDVRARVAGELVAL